MSESAQHIKTACEEILDTCAVSNLRKLTRLVTSRFNEKIKPTGMRTTQMCVLLAIGTAQGKAMNSYAEELGMDLSTLARAVDTLEEKGFINKEDGKRREKLLFLTQQAEAKIMEVYPLWQEAQAEFVSTFGAEQWGAYLNAAEKSAA